MAAKEKKIEKLLEEKMRTLQTVLNGLKHKKKQYKNLPNYEFVVSYKMCFGGIRPHNPSMENSMTIINIFF